MQRRDVSVSVSGAGASASAGLRQSFGCRSRPFIAYFSNHLPSASSTMPFWRACVFVAPGECIVNSGVNDTYTVEHVPKAYRSIRQWPKQSTSTLGTVARDERRYSEGLLSLPGIQITKKSQTSPIRAHSILASTLMKS
jgi:hypothetical protein